MSLSDTISELLAADDAMTAAACLLQELRSAEGAALTHSSSALLRPIPTKARGSHLYPLHDATLQISQQLLDGLATMQAAIDNCGDAGARRDEDDFFEDLSGTSAPESNNTEVEFLRLRSVCQQLWRADSVRGALVHPLVDLREILSGLVAYDGFLFIPNILHLLRTALHALVAKEFVTLGDRNKPQNLAELRSLRTSAFLRAVKWAPSLLGHIRRLLPKFWLRDGTVQYLDTATNPKTPSGVAQTKTDDEGSDEEDVEVDAPAEKKIVHSPFALSRFFFTAVIPSLMLHISDWSVVLAHLNEVTEGASANKSEICKAATILSSVAMLTYETVIRSQQFTPDVGRLVDARIHAADLESILQMQQQFAKKNGNRVRSMARPPPGGHGGCCGGQPRSGPEQFAYPCDVFTPLEAELAATKDVLIAKCSALAKWLPHHPLTSMEGLLFHLERTSALLSDVTQNNKGSPTQRLQPQRIKRNDVLQDVINPEPSASSNGVASQHKSGNKSTADVALRMTQIQERHRLVDDVSFCSDRDEDETDGEGVDDDDESDELMWGGCGTAYTECTLRTATTRFPLLMHSFPEVLPLICPGLCAMLRSESLSCCATALLLLDTLCQKASKYGIYFPSEDDDSDDAASRVLGHNDSDNVEGAATNASPVNGTGWMFSQNNVGDGAAYSSRSFLHVFTLMRDLVTVLVLSPSVQHRTLSRHVIQRYVLLFHSSTRKKLILGVLATSPYSSVCMVMIGMVKQEIVSHYNVLRELPTVSRTGPTPQTISSSFVGLSVFLCLVKSLDKLSRKVQYLEPEFAESLVAGLNLLRLWILVDVQFALRRCSDSPPPLTAAQQETDAATDVFPSTSQGVLFTVDRVTQKLCALKPLSKQKDAPQDVESGLRFLMDTVVAGVQNLVTSNNDGGKVVSVQCSRGAVSDIDMYALSVAVETLRDIVSTV